MNLGIFLKGLGYSDVFAHMVQSHGQQHHIDTAALDRAIVHLQSAPAVLYDEAQALRIRLGEIVRGRSDMESSAGLVHLRRPRGSSPISTLTTPEALERRIGEFTSDRLSVDWRSGPSYRLPTEEYDPSRTLDLWAHRVRINHRVLSDDDLRSPRTKVLWSLAPTGDFTRAVDIGDRHYVMDGYDFSGALMFVNPEAERVMSVSPSYALAFLEAALPKERDVTFIEPETFEDFQRKCDEVRPDLVMLSGIGMNTRTLLKMALYARQQGAKEVWLGNYAAAGPYRILDQAFDRLLWGFGEKYLQHVLAGDLPPGPDYPSLERLLSRMSWVFEGEGEQLVRRNFQTLHLAVTHGCSRTCTYCAERAFSSGVRQSSGLDPLRQRIDEAWSRGIRHVYFADPNFGLTWRRGDETSLEAGVIQYLSERRMRFSILTELQVLQRHGDWMVDRGLQKVFLGIESLSPAHDEVGTLRASLGRPQQRLTETEREVRRLRGKGVDITGLYILGNPGEALDQIWAGVERLADLVPLSQISTNIPFPGTEEFFRGAALGWIHNVDPDAGLVYGFSPWAPGGIPMDPAALRELWVRAHERVNRIRRPGGLLDSQREVQA